VAVHLAFVLFVGLGGLLVVWRPRVSWLHVPAVVYGVLLELSGWICPLTPLENHFRRLGAESGYRGGFIEHYALSLLYPARLTPQISRILGLSVLAVTAVLYATAYWRVRNRPR
jgi:hypothetical protein